MLDCLRGGQEAGIKSGRAFVLLDDLGAFLGNAHDSRASLALWLLVYSCEDLFKTSDLLLGFGFVLLERGPEFFALRGFCHLRQSRQDFLLSEVDILQRVMKQL